MQQIQFYREGIHNYMLLPGGKEIDRTAYAISLFELVNIPGFMQYDIRVLDEQAVLYYRLKYRTSLKQVLGDIRFTFDRISKAVVSIVEVLKQTENYLLNPDCVMWRSDTTFIEVDSGRLLFSYYPVVNGEQNSLKNFLTELIQFVDKKDDQAYLYIMKFYNLVTNPDCEFSELIQFVEKEGFEWKLGFGDSEVPFSGIKDYQEISFDNKKQKMIVADNYMDTQEETEKGRVTQNGTKRKHMLVLFGILTVVNLVVVLLLLLDIWTYQYIWVLAITLLLLVIAFLMERPFGEEKELDQIMEEYLAEVSVKDISLPNREKSIVIDEKDMSEETTLLTSGNEEIILEDKPQELFLKSMNSRGYSDLIMDKNSMVVGSMKSGCDYILSDKGISRMHTKLIKKEDGLYAMDMNSTNQTYLNDQPLVGGKEYLLNEGDVLCLAGVVRFVVVDKNNKES